MAEYIYMSMEILNVIHAVLDYKKFLHSYHVMLHNNKQFDTESEAEKFYYGMDNLPRGMERNKQCIWKRI